ncbi:alkaline phosphatase [Williamwhitmania taraxaci]|uniref:Alkaline phosphatase n=1 Tax=Williamwhitmania taraxaci TaxID=1640674 RepID=A0A1G6SA73_9BACT|nr:alkaline phosphatase [Williamwhitmania taraxaci]SDD13564.1 alkaline phosphatase [Williamwhitmania taraxaci]
MRRVLLFAIGLLLCSFTWAQKETPPKYIFFFIGDGMGISQVNSAEVYLQTTTKSNARLSFTTFPEVGFATTFAANRYITCSAAAGTALATGSKTNINYIGINPQKDTLISFASELKNRGFAVGIITSVSVDHATPACFYAHVDDRNKYYEIGTHLTKSGFDFFAGSTLLRPSGPKGDLYAMAKKSGYKIFLGPNKIDSIRVSKGPAVWLATADSSMSSLTSEIDRGVDDITLPQFTKAAIAKLEKQGSFFLMAEGGKIDWSCHSNDAAGAIHEVLDFSSAIEVALEFYKKHPDQTLIVVTADHETGGFSLGNNANHYDSYIHRLSGQKMSYDLLVNIMEKEVFSQPDAASGFEKALEILKVQTALGDSTKGLKLVNADIENLRNAYNETLKGRTNPKPMYSKSSKFIATAIGLLNKKAGIGWTSGSHTGLPVPVFAIGCGANRFSSFMDNTDIPKNILQLTIPKR